MYLHVTQYNVSISSLLKVSEPRTLDYNNAGFSVTHGFFVSIGKFPSSIFKQIKFTIVLVLLLKLRLTFPRFRWRKPIMAILCLDILVVLLPQDF